MKHYLLIPIFISLSLTSMQARDCSLEGKQTAEDIVKEMPAAPKEQKLEECAARGDFFESRIKSCDTGTFEAGCKARLDEIEKEKR